MKEFSRILLYIVLLTSCTNNDIMENKKLIQKETIENNKVIQLSENHWQCYTDIIINASSDKVWETLTNWTKIKTWSGSLKTIEGELKNNGRVTVSYFVNGQTYETVHTFILIEGKEFGWSDPMEGTFSGLTDNHRFKIEKISEDQTRFIQSDDFKGEGNQNISAKDVANQTIKFFPHFNKELKTEVEKIK